MSDSGEPSAIREATPGIPSTKTGCVDTAWEAKVAARPETALAPATVTGPATPLPGVTTSVQGLYAAMFSHGVDPLVLELVHLRASQVNGCAPCVFAGITAAKQHGETDERLHQVVAWRESGLFTEAERSALALAEAATRLADPADPVPDDVWDAAAAHFEQTQLAGLVVMVALTNFFNRINVSIREPAGTTWG